MTSCKFARVVASSRDFGETLCEFGEGSCDFARVPASLGLFGIP